MRLPLTAISALLITVAGCSAGPVEDTLPADTPPAQSPTGSPLDPSPLATSATLVVSAAGVFEALTPLYVADALGEFEKENIRIEYVTLPSPDALPALMLGQIDISVIGLSANFFNAVGEGAPIKMVFPGPSSSEGDGLWVRSEWLDHQGEKPSLAVAASQGPTGLNAVPIVEWMEAQGVEPSTRRIQTLPIGELASALDLGVLDAAWLNSPAHLPFLEDGSAQLVAEYADGQTAFAYVFSERLLLEEPEVGRAFLRALLRTQNAWLTPGYKDNDEVASALADRLGKSVEELRQTDELDFLTEFDSTLFDRAQEQWIETGGILAFDVPLSPDDYIDTNWIAELLREETGQ